MQLVENHPARSRGKPLRVRNKGPLLAKTPPFQGDPCITHAESMWGWNFMFPGMAASQWGPSEAQCWEECCWLQILGWPGMKQWLCMLQGILQSMRSPRLCWALFILHVICNRGVRKISDFKYSGELLPCSTEHTTSPVLLEHIRSRRDFTFISSQWKWKSLYSLLCQMTRVAWVTKYQFHYASFLTYSFTYSFIQQMLLSACNVSDIFLELGIHESTNQEKNSYPSGTYVVSMQWVVVLCRF
jgi:hypothetical protein